MHQQSERLQDQYNEGTIDAIEDLVSQAFDGQDIQELADDESGCYHRSILDGGEPTWMSTQLLVKLVAQAYEMGCEDGLPE
jgi:hypothetical protein